MSLWVNNYRCDNKFHCGDRSDELNCNLVYQDRGYDKSRAPILGDIIKVELISIGDKWNIHVLYWQEGQKVDNLKINVDITVNSIINIDDVSGSFKIFYILDLFWNDINVQFCFLQDNEQNNIVKNETWVPSINHMLELTSQTVNKETTILKQSKPHMYADLDEVSVCEAYFGKLNCSNILLKFDLHTSSL